MSPKTFSDLPVLLQVDVFNFLTIEELLNASEVSTDWHGIIQINFFDQITSTKQMESKSLVMDPMMLIRWVLKCRKLTKFNFRHLHLVAVDHDIAMILFPNFYDMCPAITIFRGISEFTTIIAVHYLRDLMVRKGSCNQIKEYSTTPYYLHESSSQYIAWNTFFNYNLKQLRIMIGADEPVLSFYHRSEYALMRPTLKSLYLKLPLSFTNSDRKTETEYWINFGIFIIANMAGAKMRHNSPTQPRLLRLHDAENIICAESDNQEEAEKMCNFISQLTSLTGSFNKRFFDHCIKFKCVTNLIKFKQLRYQPCQLDVLEYMPNLTHLTVSTEDAPPSILKPFGRWIKSNGHKLESLKISIAPNKPLITEVSNYCFNLRKFQLIGTRDDWRLNDQDFNWNIMIDCLRYRFPKLILLNVCSDPRLTLNTLRQLRQAVMYQNNLKIVSKYANPWDDN